MKKISIMAVMLCMAASPAHAQLGGLKKLKDKMKGQDAGPPTSNGTARVTAHVMWTIEARGKQMQEFISINHPSGEQLLTANDGTEQINYTGDVTAVIELDPNALPGGMITQASGGRPTILPVIPNQPVPYGKLISLNGTIAGRDVITQAPKCAPLKGQKVSGGTGGQTASAELSTNVTVMPSNTTLQLTFEGDKPVHFAANASNVEFSGDVKYACGGTRPMKVSPVITFNPPATQSDGWVFTTAKTADGYGMTMTWQGEEHGLQVKKVGRLTWSAPKAPSTPPISQKAMAMPESASGALTFTQGGKDATWKLAQIQSQGGMGMQAKVLLFTPNGQPPSDDTGMLTLMVMNMNGAWSMMGMSINKGPAGDSEYNSESNKCNVKVAQQGEGFNVSGTCSGGFKGAAVSKFNLTSSK